MLSEQVFWPSPSRATTIILDLQNSWSLDTSNGKHVLLVGRTVLCCVYFEFLLALYLLPIGIAQLGLHALYVVYEPPLEYIKARSPILPILCCLKVYK